MMAARPSRRSGWSSTLKTRIRVGSLIWLARFRPTNLNLPAFARTVSRAISLNGQSLEGDTRYDRERTAQSQCRLPHGSTLLVSHQFFPLVRVSAAIPNVRGEPQAMPRSQFRNRCRAPAAAVDWPHIRVRLQFHSRRSDGKRLPALPGQLDKRHRQSPAAMIALFLQQSPESGRSSWRQAPAESAKMLAPDPRNPSPMTAILEQYSGLLE